VIPLPHTRGTRGTTRLQGNIGVFVRMSVVKGGWMGGTWLGREWCATPWLCVLSVLSPAPTHPALHQPRWLTRARPPSLPMPSGRPPHTHRDDSHWVDPLWALL
jgi:hypothetical protein